jgi:hypothetical protein
MVAYLALIPYAMFLFVALSFAMTAVLLQLLGRIFVMVLLCQPRDFGCSYFLLLYYVGSYPYFASKLCKKYACTLQINKIRADHNRRRMQLRNHGGTTQETPAPERLLG